MGWASQWRVRYQNGLPCKVSNLPKDLHLNYTLIKKDVTPLAHNAILLS